MAQQQKRQDDIYYKNKDNKYTRVLEKLQAVRNAKHANQKADRMWERLVEIVLFNRTKSHRQPGQVLKAFIKTDEKTDTGKISRAELKRLATCFDFLDKSYADTSLGSSRLARDLPHFYTMVTTLLGSDLLEAEGAPPAFPIVRDKLIAFAKLLPDDATVPESIAADLDDYKKAAKRQTTHPGQRRVRQEKLLKILGEL